MAEEKTFRYGFIMLGFFLVMTGMFIMSVEKPQIYATFCAGGILLIAVGVTWSMCQCYPRVGREGWGLCPGVWGSRGFRELWGEDLGSSEWDLQGVGAWGSPEHGCDPPVSLAEGMEG